MIKKIAISILIMPFLFVGLAQAQTNDLPDPGILPDNPFYFLKSWSEGIGTFFTFDEVRKAERFLDLSEKRLAEAKALVEKGSMDHATRAIERYEEQLEQAMQRAESGKEKGMDTDEVLERISERTLKHQEVLADVYERVPEEAREGIKRAMENSMREHEEALQAISEEKREEAMERMETKREEARDRAEEARERGVDVPQIPEREDIEEGMTPETSIDTLTEPETRKGFDLSGDVEQPTTPSSSDDIERPETPETPEVPGGRP
jgi:hypothetical protein